MDVRPLTLRDTIPITYKEKHFHIFHQLTPPRLLANPDQHVNSNSFIFSHSRCESHRFDHVKSKFRRRKDSFCEICRQEYHVLVEHVEVTEHLNIAGNSQLYRYTLQATLSYTGIYCRQLSVIQVYTAGNSQLYRYILQATLSYTGIYCRQLSVIQVYIAGNSQLYRYILQATLSYTGIHCRQLSVIKVYIAGNFRLYRYTLLSVIQVERSKQVEGVWCGMVWWNMNVNASSLQAVARLPCNFTLHLGEGGWGWRMGGGGGGGKEKGEENEI